MKIKEEKILYPVQNSFKILRYSVPNFKMAFHFHPEYELVYIIKGSGLRYIGDSIQKFQSGDMVFVGPNLGHMWISDENKKEENAEAFVLQFSGELFASMINTPEFRSIKSLLERANSGLKIISDIQDIIFDLMEYLRNSEGPESIIKLIEILNLMSKNESIRSLNLSEKSNASGNQDKRISAVFQYVKAFYKEKISVDQAASMANMEKSAFCRFFKGKTQKTFTQFLNESRIDRACELLLKNEFSISQIAFECGFNNLANFYRQFKKITGKTPGEYVS